MFFTHIVMPIKLNNAARGARSDDSNSLVLDGLEYVNEKYGPLEPPIPAKERKAKARGFNHPMIARLLCPIDYTASFEKDPKGYVIILAILHANRFLFRFCDQLVNGSVKVCSTDFPLCIYDEEMINKEDPSAGLLRSAILVVVRLCICYVDAGGLILASFLNTSSPVPLQRFKTSRVAQRQKRARRRRIR